MHIGFCVSNQGLSKSECGFYRLTEAHSINLVGEILDKLVTLLDVYNSGLGYIGESLLIKNILRYTTN